MATTWPPRLDELQEAPASTKTERPFTGTETAYLHLNLFEKQF